LKSIKYLLLIVGCISTAQAMDPYESHVAEGKGPLVPMLKRIDDSKKQAHLYWAIATVGLGLLAVCTSADVARGNHAMGKGVAVLGVLALFMGCCWAQQLIRKAPERAQT